MSKHPADVPLSSKQTQTIAAARFGLQLVCASSKNWALTSGGIMVALSVFPVAIVYLHKLIIDVLTEGISSGTDVAMGMLLLLIAALTGIEIVYAFGGAVSRYVNEKQQLLAQDHVLSTIHEKSRQLDLAHFENPAYHDTLHLAEQEAPARTASLVQHLGAILQSSLSLVAVLLFLMTYHWGISLLLIVSMLPGLWVQVKSSEILFGWQKGAAAKEREAAYYHALATGAQAAKESRVFGIGDVFSRWCMNLREGLREQKLKIQFWRLIREFSVQAGTLIAVYGGYFYFAYQTASGVFTLGDMVVFFAAFFRAQNFLRQLVGGVVGLHQALLFIDSLQTMLRLKPEITSGDRGPTPPKKSPPIEFRDVSFSYPGQTRSALEGVSLRIEPGSHVAIVGKNGSGKSTLIKLICRLYDCTGGQIRLGRRDIRKFDLEAYRKQFSVLFQDHLQLDLTARQNIWLGASSLPLDSDQIDQVAKLSGAEDVISGLPEGLDTMLGKQFEHGEQLSQGEWQKVALARALAAEAAVTILDEPTSWMDPESEFGFFQRFHENSLGRTVIMVSHRLSTVRMADQIIVMDDGQLLETGTHEELMVKDGRYAELFELQAKDYVG